MTGFDRSTFNQDLSVNRKEELGKQEWIKTSSKFAKGHCFFVFVFYVGPFQESIFLTTIYGLYFLASKVNV